MSRLGGWALLLTILALGLLALIFPTSSTVGRVVLVLWGAVPSSIVIWQYSYNHYERHRLAVNRLVFWLRNPESTWGMTATFDVAARRAFETAVETIDHSLGPSDRAVSRSANEAVWQIAGLTVKLASDTASDPIDGEQAVLRVEILRAPRAYRAWQPLISGPVSSLVERVDAAVHPAVRKYTVDIAFPGENPYFGLFINSVQQNAIARVQIDYFEQRATERDLVQVRGDRVTVVTDSLTAARESSLRFLTLTRMRET